MKKDRPCLISMPHLVRLHKFRKFHILTDFAIYSTNTKKVMAVAFRYFNISIARQKCSEPPSPKRSIKADLKEWKLCLDFILRLWPCQSLRFWAKRFRDSLIWKMKIFQACSFYLLTPNVWRGKQRKSYWQQIE